MLNNSNHKKKLNLLQAFRGLAAILVLLCHGNNIFNLELHQDFLFNVFGFGWAGVDFFFVLSGFIIFYIHKADIGNPNRFKSYILKRFIRIYPLYWIILTGKIAASFLFTYGGGDIHNRNFGEIVKAILLYPQDKHILLTSFLGISWTLSHEVFFYLMFSLLILVKPKLSVPVIIAWIIGSFLNSINIIDVFRESFLLQFIFNERNLEFVMGCLAAYIIFNYNIKNGTMLTYVAGFLFTVSAINWTHLTQISPVIYYGIPLMLLVVGAVSLEMSLSIKVPAIFVYIGNASYSIYLMHGFILSNILKILIKLKLGILFQNVLILNIAAIILAIITVGLGCAVYSYIEKPLLSNLRLILATVQPKGISHPPT